MHIEKLSHFHQAQKGRKSSRHQTRKMLCKFMNINLWAILLLIERRQGIRVGDGWREKITRRIFFGEIRDGRATDVDFFLLRGRFFCQWILVAKLFESKLILSLPFRSAILIPCWENEKFNRIYELWKIYSYHVFTCVSDKFNWLATSPRSATDKYFWQRNFRSRKASCECVNAVLRRRFRFKVPLFPSRVV